MFDNQLRTIKDRILIPAACRIGKRFTPNQITSIGFFIGLLIPVFILNGQYRLAFIFWVMNRILDGLDGVVARQMDMKTDFGGYYDILTDYVLYALIPLSLAVRTGQMQIYAAALVLMGVFYVNSVSWMYLSGILEKRKLEEPEARLTTLAMPTGVIEGAETIVFYSLFMLFPSRVFILMITMTVLTFLGIVQRLFYAYRKLKKAAET